MFFRQNLGDMYTNVFIIKCFLKSINKCKRVTYWFSSYYEFRREILFAPRAREYYFILIYIITIYMIYRAREEKNPTNGCLSEKCEFWCSSFLTWGKKISWREKVLQRGFNLRKKNRSSVILWKVANIIIYQKGHSVHEIRPGTHLNTCLFDWW